MSTPAGRVFQDTRSHLERMKRLPLRKLALKAGAQVGPDATKDELVALLKAMKVDPLDPKWDVGWYQEIREHPTEGRFVELYPFQKPNQSSRMNVDAVGQLQQELAKKEREHDKERQEDEGKIGELERTVGALQTMLQKIMEREAERKPSFPVEKLVPWQLIQMCKDMGIEYKGMSPDEMKAAILGKDASQFHE